jgi:hypothetical protein
MTMMKPLKDYYKFAVRGGDVGTEVETEFLQLDTEPVIPGWKVHNEGSIRGVAREFVTDGPVPFHKKRAAYDALAGVLGKLQVNVASHRTSVHNHINVSRISPMQTWTAASLYWMVENLLFSYCGEERVGNLFCLRLSDAEGLMEDVFADLNAEYPFKTLLENDDLRYAGLNVNAIRKFGSLEFRGMRGVYDADTLDIWSTACYNIVHGAGRFSSPENLMDEFYKSDKKEFLAQIFGAQFTDVICKHKEWKDVLDDGVMSVLPLAYYHDWEAWAKKMEKRREAGPIPPLNRAGPVPRVARAQAQAQAQANQLIRGALNLQNVHAIAGEGGVVPNAAWVLPDRPAFEEED